MGAIDKAIAHFKDKGQQVINVLEWDLDVYFTPFTIGEKETLTKHDGMEFYLRALILKAEDEQGEKIFTLADRKKLKDHVDGSVVQRIVNEMSTMAVSVEDSSKN